MSHYNPAVEIDEYEVENSFWLRSHPSRMATLLAHYALYRKIVELPGAVVELGVRMEKLANDVVPAYFRAP